MTINLKKILRFSNVLTLTIAILYTICTLTFVIAPAFAYSFYESWFHGLGLSADGAIRPVSMTVEQYLLGLICLSMLTYIGGLFFEFFAQTMKLTSTNMNEPEPESELRHVH